MSGRALLGLAVLVAMLTTCGQASTNPAGSTTEQSESPNSTASTTPADPVDPDQVETIRIAGWQGETDSWTTLLETFSESHPHIQAEYVAVPATDYDAHLDQGLDQAGAPDVFGCFGYDWALDRFEAGQLADLSGLGGMANFTASARAPWSTDDGRVTFCVPVIANMTGFFFNRDIFAELDLEVPVTEAEFFEVLDKVHNDGRYVPIGLGLQSSWVGNGLVFENLGPQYWHGDAGRLAMISGASSFTDSGFRAVFENLERWPDYLPEDPASMSRGDGQALFFEGKAAVMPGGSWEIRHINASGVNAGVFRAPDPDGGTCFVNQQPDLGLGLNPGSTNTAAATEFLDWVAGPEFAAAYMDLFPGLFTLVSDVDPPDESLSREMIAWTRECSTTPRLTSQGLSRGGAAIEQVLAEASIDVMTGSIKADEAVRRANEALGSG